MSFQTLSPLSAAVSVAVTMPSTLVRQLKQLARKRLDAPST